MDPGLDPNDNPWQPLNDEIQRRRYREKCNEMIAQYRCRFQQAANGNGGPMHAAPALALSPLIAPPPTASPTCSWCDAIGRCLGMPYAHTNIGEQCVRDEDPHEQWMDRLIAHDTECGGDIKYGTCIKCKTILFDVEIATVENCKWDSSINNTCALL